MKSKAPLALMEQLVMLLVFAVAAALCLQAFVQSDRLSRRSGDRDRAAALCQSAAETIRHTAGDLPAAAERLGATRSGDGELTIFYDTDWRPAASTSPNIYPMGYTLGACRVDSGVPGLGKASVWVQEDETGEELFRIEISWQEVVPNG